MRNRSGHNSNRIPIQFIDDELETQDESSPRDRHEESEDSAEELGEASAYEGETEMQRRIERGEESDTASGKDRADDSDIAGGPPPEGLPQLQENRQDPRASSQDGQSARDGSELPDEVTLQSAVSGPMMAELIATRSELKRVENQSAELLEQLQRRQADFDNYRKRIARDRTELYSRLVADVVHKFLPVLDNLGRALEAESSVRASESEEFRHFFHGVELIYKQLNEVLESLGLRPVTAVGYPFDPHLHEAVITEQTEDFAPDTVMQEIVRGYLLGEKLLRPAIVKVATR